MSIKCKKEEISSETKSLGALCYSEKFSKHLEQIRRAKQRSDEICSDAEMLDTPSASIAAVWEIVFDRLCSTEVLETSELNTISGIIQKLSSAQTRQLVPSQDNNGLSEDTLRKIEAKLKLL